MKGIKHFMGSVSCIGYETSKFKKCFKKYSFQVVLKKNKSKSVLDVINNSDIKENEVLKTVVCLSLIHI